MARKPDEEKREKILKAAIGTFGEKGFTETTVQDISDEAGFAPGTVYTYFENKEELFREAVEAGWTEFIRGMERLKDRDLPFEDGILWLIDSGFEVLKKLYPLLRGMYSDAARRFLMRDRLENICDILGGLILEGNGSGLFQEYEDPEIRDFIFRSIVRGVFFDISTTAPEKLDDEIENLRRLIKGSFANRLI